MKLRVPGLLLAGGVLVLLVNAVVLAGVAWNRSGVPEATLQLSERELEMPSLWHDTREDSGLALDLRWRLPVAAAREDEIRGGQYGVFTPAHWLDADRLAALGFRLPPLPDEFAARRRSPPAREVWLALEFDGPAYAHSLQVAQERLAAARQLLDARPEDTQQLHRVELAGDLLRQAREEWTRLFVVDADRDPAALRARYPDRERYAVVRGRVRPVTAALDPGNTQQLAWRGLVEDLSVATVHVPLGFRAVFETPPGDAGQQAQARYEVTLSWGRRGEPWIVAARPADR
jgi:hypothetical protein